MNLKSISNVRTIVFAKEGEGKKRAISNRDERGAYTIKDGKLTANGMASPRQYRCNVPTR